MFGEHFKSYEHGLFWKMAMDLGKPHLAYRIKGLAHASIAKALSNEMKEELRHE